MKKNFNLNLNKLASSNKGSDWQKGLFLAVTLILVLLFVGFGYLFIKPISRDVKETIDQELKDVNFTFNQETLENIKARQNPIQQEITSAGKNPFAPY